MYNNETGFYEGYIYCIHNNVNNKEYIGQTITTIEHRMGQHFSNGTSHCKVLKNAIQKYGNDSFVYFELDRLFSKDKKELIKLLNQSEKNYIQQRGTICPKGYNIDKGGGQSSYYMKGVDVYNSEGLLIRSFDSATEAASFYNLNKSIICNMCNGKIHKSRVTSLIFRWKDHFFDEYDPFTTESQFKVFQFSLDGELLCTYNNVTEAEKEMRKVYNYVSSISRALLSNEFTAYGYYWSKENKFDFDLNNYRNNIPIDQYSVDGDFLSSWHSIAESCKGNNLDPDKCSSAIRKQLNGLTFSPQFGYVWRYKGDSFNKYKVNKDYRRSKTPVDQYSLKGQFINSYDTITEAAIANNIPLEYYSHISKVCKGKSSYALGYVWRYRGDPYNKYPINIRKGPTQVDQYTLDGKYIKTYSSFIEATKSVNKDPDNYRTHIKKICDRKGKSAFGYVWRYHEDSFE